MLIAELKVNGGEVVQGEFQNELAAQSLTRTRRKSREG